VNQKNQNPTNNMAKAKRAVTAPKVAKVTVVKYQRFVAADGTEYDVKGGAEQRNRQIKAVLDLNAAFETAHTVEYFLGNDRGVAGEAGVAETPHNDSGKLVPDDENPLLAVQKRITNDVANAKIAAAIKGKPTKPVRAKPAAVKVTASRKPVKPAKRRAAPADDLADMTIAQAKKIVKEQNTPGRPSREKTRALEILRAAGDPSVPPSRAGQNAKASKPKAAPKTAKPKARKSKTEDAASANGAGASPVIVFTNPTHVQPPGEAGRPPGPPPATMSPVGLVPPPYKPAAAV